MPRIVLTDRFCATAKPLDGKRADYFDNKTAGLALRVGEQGHRSWCFHYRAPGSDKRVRLGLGTYPGTSLAAARGKAIEARSHVESGTDPRSILQATASMTVAALIEKFLSDPQRAALRSKAKIEQRLRRNVLPLIGAVKISELRRRDVRNVVDAVLRRGRKTAANRVFEDIRAMINWAVANEYLELNPIGSMPKPSKPKIGDRCLSEDEIKTLWQALPEALPGQCGEIIKLCLITSQRPNECAGMRRSELDLSSREWRLPGNRTKNASPHTVPLSDLAISIIKQAIPKQGDAIFSLSAQMVSEEMWRANKQQRFGIKHWTARDLRRTAITHMGRLGVPPIVLGHVANHRTTTKAGITLAVYSQYEYGAEKRAALDLWAQRLQAIVGTDSVATITRLPARS
jgi:integrase